MGNEFWPALILPGLLVAVGWRLKDANFSPNAGDLANKPDPFHRRLGWVCMALGFWLAWLFS